ALNRRPRPDPLGWAELQRKLLRLEQLVQAGKAYREEYDDTNGRIDALFERLTGPSSRDDLAAYSLPLARQLRPWPTDPSADELPGPWNTPAQKPDDKEPDDETPEDSPEDSAEDSAEETPTSDDAAESTPPPEDSPPEDSPPETLQPYDYLPAASAAWNWLLERPTRETLSEALTFTDRAENRLGADVIELHFARMAHSHLDWDGPQDLTAPLRRSLVLRNLAEEAAAPADERIHYWLRELVDSADRQRRTAEDRLMLGGRAMLAADEPSTNAEAGYRQATGRADQIAAAGVILLSYWELLLSVTIGGIAVYLLAARLPRLIVPPLAIALDLIGGSFGPWGAAAVTLRSHGASTPIL
ncbi:hypothetical protein LCGC14_3014230, partial [marine sediment metagenome]